MGGEWEAGIPNQEGRREIWRKEVSGEREGRAKGKRKRRKADGEGHGGPGEEQWSEDQRCD